MFGEIVPTEKYKWSKEAKDADHSVSWKTYEIAAYVKHTGRDISRRTDTRPLAIYPFSYIAHKASCTQRRISHYLSKNRHGRKSLSLSGLDAPFERSVTMASHGAFQVHWQGRW